MNWWMHLPLASWVLFVFALGLGVGSFLNVLVARLPAQKTPLWPQRSYCFACRRPLRLRDNLPVLGYLLSGGRCRLCGAAFSSRYLWVELGTGLAFVALFAVEVLAQTRPDPWFFAPGMRFNRFDAVPPFPALAIFAYHACLLSLLVACAVIDAEHKVIPHELTYLGVVIGLAGSVLMPWPWPSLDPQVLAAIPGAAKWGLAEAVPLTPVGATLWPAWIPEESFPPGTWQLGLLNGVAGALAGTFLVRAIKWLFETSLGQDALGLGDADLMMMCGAFLGWPVVVLGFFAGVIVALVTQVPVMLWDRVRGRGVDRHMPFGPGLAGGVLVVWLGWPRAAHTAGILYQWPILLFGAVFMGGGMVVFGLLLRRPAEPEGAA